MKETANIDAIDFCAANAGQALVRSLHETGFAVIRNHPLKQAQLDLIYKNWLVFFQGDEKRQYLYDPQDKNGTQEGYFPQHISETAVGASAKDIKEFFHVVPSASLPPSLKTDILAYRKETMELGGVLLKWIQESTPAEISTRFTEPLFQILSPTASLLRILHYPPLSGDETAQAVRAAAHEDINLLTILPVSHQPGLQVKTSDGQWLELKTNTGEIIVNTGDMLQEASLGFFPSTTHRVVNPQGSYTNISRVSMPFFLTPRLDFVLSDRYTAGSYLTERLRVLNR